MRYDEIFPKDFFNAEDLLRGPKVLTIRSMGIEEVGPDKKPKLVARFDETHKRLVVNHTNAETIKQMFGPDTQDAIGGRIELFTERATYNGKPVPAIRVRRPSRTHDLPLRGEPPRRPSSASGEPLDDGAPPHDTVPEGPDESDLSY